MTPTPQQQEAIRAIVGAVLEAVAAAGPTGAPGGIIYSALMASGCSLSQYESLMSALVRLGKLRRDGECYHLATA